MSLSDIVNSISTERDLIWREDGYYPCIRVTANGVSYPAVPDPFVHCNPVRGGNYWVNRDLLRNGNEDK